MMNRLILSALLCVALATGAAAQINLNGAQTIANGGTGASTAAGARANLLPAACTLASAATTDLGLCSSGPSSVVTITGTTNISGFGSTAAVGSQYDLVFSGALTIFNSATLVLPGTIDAVTAANYTLRCGVPTTLGSWVCTARSAPGEITNGGTWFNYNPNSLRHWRAKVAGVRAGTGRARLLIAGDSTTAGAGAGTGGTFNYNGAYSKAYSRYVASLLTAAGIPVSDNSMWAQQQTTIPYGTYDTRATLGTGWGSGVGTLGAALFAYTTGVAGTLAYTPTGQFDTFIVYYVTLTGNGSFNVNIDGGASLLTLSANSAASVSSHTFTVAKGSHTVNLVANNDGNLSIVAIVAYDSTTPAVDLIQTGHSGALIANFIGTTNPWSPENIIKNQIVPDLTLINLTINDSNASTSLASYIANMQTVITDAQLSGDVVLIAGFPSNTANATNGTLDQYVAALAGLAITNNVPMLSFKARWKSYAVTNPLMPYFDALHPEVSGYWDAGAAIAAMLADH